MIEIKKILKNVFIIYFIILSCNSAFAFELPSIVGEARRVLLGPVDEHLGYEFIKEMPILIIPVAIIEDKDILDIESVGNSQLFFETYNDHPQTIHLKTDNQGAFSVSIATGSYFICTVYKFPRDKNWQFYAKKRILIKNNSQIKLKITFNPAWQGLKIEDF
ncbi:hypothetical protein MNBD_GAMMA03-2087 [hydrothermal vent metagenome]|uniref:Uncharacterized protein n=1 Tax=hydrothermal vent metagenome TaxID=652676 RepID=A0A3B0WAT8_9ZZZZ